MQIEATVVKEYEGFQVALFSEKVEITDADVDGMAKEGVAPDAVQASRSGFLGVSDEEELTREKFRAILEAVLPKSALTRRTLVDYLGLEKTPNDVGASDILKAARPEEYQDLLEAADLIYSLFKQEYYVTELGQRLLSQKAYGFKGLQEEQVQCQVLYKNGQAHRFIRGQQAQSLEALTRETVVVEPVSNQHIEVPLSGVFHIRGHIDLTKYDLTGKVTKKQKETLLEEFRTEPQSGETAEDAIYRELNRIAMDVPVEGAYLLLKPELVEFLQEHQLAAGDLESTIRKSEAVGLMARRNGQVVAPGNPLFDESTLADGAKWYLAFLLEE